LLFNAGCNEQVFFLINSEKKIFGAKFRPSCRFREKAQKNTHFNAEK